MLDHAIVGVLASTAGPGSVPGADALDSLLVLGVILVAGTIGGWLARRIKVPSITGNILAGIMIGPAALDVFGHADASRVLLPVSTFAMGLIAVAIGGHLSYRRIHNALRRIVLVSLLEVCGALVFVTLGAWLCGQPMSTAILLGTVACATAPGTTVALVRETRAKGTFVKTLLAVVALDNILCIMLFAFAEIVDANFFEHPESGFAFLPALQATGIQLGGSLLLGLLLGVATLHLVRLPSSHNFSVMVVTVLLACGVAASAGLSPLLACLFLGVYLGNSSELGEEHLASVEPLEMLLYTCFFTLAGVSLHLDTLASAGLICLVYVIARFLGKGLGAGFGGWLSGTSPRVWRNLPLGLVPQAGVAIGLVVLLHGDARIPKEVSDSIATVVLAAVTINEIIGPFFTRLALKRSKEVGRDRLRLIEFIEEEFILTGLKVAGPAQLIERLVAFFARVHPHPDRNQREVIREQLTQRLETRTAAIGSGVAILPARLAQGERIQGVLVVLQDALDLGAIDGEPVRLVMVITTPPEQGNYLQVMARLAAMLSDVILKEGLLRAPDAHHAWEVIESNETPDYNEYLEAEEDLKPVAAH